METDTKISQVRSNVEDLRCAIQTIAVRMNAQFVLDETKVASFIKANRLDQHQTGLQPQGGSSVVVGLNLPDPSA